MADTKQATPDAIGEVLRNRILFIGGPNEAIPQVATNNGVQVYSGYPNDLIKELKRSLASRSGPDRGQQDAPELSTASTTTEQWLHQHAWPRLEEIFVAFSEGPVTRTRMQQLIAPLFDEFAKAAREGQAPKGDRIKVELEPGCKCEYAIWTNAKGCPLHDVSDPVQAQKE